MARNADTIGFIHYGADGEETEHRLPARWEICSSCEGCGTDRGQSVECDGGGFTGAEWSELDDDFKQDYLDGVYDRPCRECRGTGKVQVVDRDRCQPGILALFDLDQREEAEYRAMVRAELRFGC